MFQMIWLLSFITFPKLLKRKYCLECASGSCLSRSSLRHGARRRSCGRNHITTNSTVFLSFMFGSYFAIDAACWEAVDAQRRRNVRKLAVAQWLNYVVYVVCLSLDVALKLKFYLVKSDSTEYETKWMNSNCAMLAVLNVKIGKNFSSLIHRIEWISVLSLKRNS